MRMRQTDYLGLLLSLFLALGIALGAPSAAWAQPWTTVASTGTVDNASANNVILEGSFATLRACGTATIRYNIVAVEGLLGVPFPPGVDMHVRYRDSGDRDRVLVELKGVKLSSGSEFTLLVLDSDNFAPDLLVQTQTATDICAFFDFGQNAYYIQATLLREPPQVQKRFGPRSCLGPPSFPGSFQIEDRPALQTIQVVTPSSSTELCIK